MIWSSGPLRLKMKASAAIATLSEVMITAPKTAPTNSTATAQKVSVTVRFEAQTAISATPRIS